MTKGNRTGEFAYTIQLAWRVHGRVSGTLAKGNGHSGGQCDIRNMSSHNYINAIVNHGTSIKMKIYHKKASVEHKHKERIDNMIRDHNFQIL